MKSLPKESYSVDAQFSVCMFTLRIVARIGNGSGGGDHDTRLPIQQPARSPRRKPKKEKAAPRRDSCSRYVRRHHRYEKVAQEQKQRKQLIAPHRLRHRLIPPQPRSRGRARKRKQLTVAAGELQRTSRQHPPTGLKRKSSRCRWRLQRRKAAPPPAGSSGSDGSSGPRPPAMRAGRGGTATAPDIAAAQVQR